VGICICSLAISQVFAHSIPGAQTLHDLCRAADVVAVGRVMHVATAAPNDTTLPPVEVRIVELLREGDAPTGIVRFLPHTHGDDQYVVGEELLVFLERTTSAERAKEAPYEAVDAISDRLVLSDKQRNAWIEAARTYVALGKGPRNKTDPRELGRVSITMLANGEPKLSQMALRDLTLAGTSAIISEYDVPWLLRVVRDASRPAMLRVGVLSELERRKLVPVGSHWVALLDSVAPNERSTVISGAKSRWFVPEVNAVLVSLVDRGTPDEAISAARAVGAAGNDAAIDALERAVKREPAELRYAALSSLRRINSNRARDKLAGFAQSHPDAITRKMAANELALLPPMAPVVESSGGAELPPAGLRRLWWLVPSVLVLVFGVVFLRKRWPRRT